MKPNIESRLDRSLIVVHASKDKDVLLSSLDSIDIYIYATLHGISLVSLFRNGRPKNKYTFRGCLRNHIFKHCRGLRVFRPYTLPTRITTECATSLDIDLPNLTPNYGAFSSDLSHQFPIFCLATMSHEKIVDTAVYSCSRIIDDSLNRFHLLVEILLGVR